MLLFFNHSIKSYYGKINKNELYKEDLKVTLLLSSEKLLSLSAVIFPFPLS